MKFEIRSIQFNVVPRSRKEGWTYDVFLSFRGEDTRNNFVDHLFSALTLKGIHTFKDDKMLGGGQPISEELVKAIKESRWAVVVFSKNCATSCWCLDELSYIMKCHKQMGGQKKVLPVFYHVDPSDVRRQKGDFATAFETHEDKFKDGEMDKVNKWREALTAAASLSGQHILPEYGYGSSRENHLVEIEPRIDALISLLKMEATQEVRIVGIWGMGGISKTTIARALFNRVAHKFEGSSFVSDIRENSSSKKDMCTLQERILNDILGERHGYKITDRDQGAEIIQERCCRKKVLLVLDGVNDVKQLEFLVATCEWFGPGSRIIITNRDQHLLSYANSNDQYKPALLSGDQAVELFSRHAFNKRSPSEGYEELSFHAIHHAGGLPLALKTNLWESALRRLAKTQDNEIMNTFKLSYDNLDVSDQQMFLDIACFYKGKHVGDVFYRFGFGFGFDPEIGISVLVERSLITVSSTKIDSTVIKKVEMHDIIQEMGRKVVQAHALNSRLWELEKIHDLINKKELGLVEGIVVPWEKAKESLIADVFKSMKNLRLLDCCQNFTSCEPTFLPGELRWFCWRQYPFSSLPVAHMSKLVGLEMKDGNTKHLWKGKNVYNPWNPLSLIAPRVSSYNNPNLRYIHLKGCYSLERFPDVSGAPNIQILNLSFCENMVEVDESVGSLKILILLDMRSCHKLKCLPSMLKTKSLMTLILCGCCLLKEFQNSRHVWSIYLE
uniref:disease resistance protein Roq1-like n=1 Tax=Erigeron canadensis TaxID=72917 RepID=UPI001CB9ADB6|nr:disease resistance protein Roq1-like [Erigeron canadensis]